MAQMLLGMLGGWRASWRNSSSAARVGVGLGHFDDGALLGAAFAGVEEGDGIDGHCKVISAPTGPAPVAVLGHGVNDVGDDGS